MASDPGSVHAQTQAPNKRQDDFDMAKLSKQLKHDQRRSSMSKHKVAKLTPAEIRSLNYSATSSKAGSVRSIDRSAVHSLAPSVSPYPPDNVSAFHDPRSAQKSSTGPDLPRPSISPSRERRGSTASNRVIHAPRPLSHVQAAAFSNAAGPSRPSSQTSYRGIATYRGPEMTRSGSLTMLQRPSPQIVGNPLSNFSRPRQSTLISSPDRVASTRQSEDSYINTSTPRHQPYGEISRTASRRHSPIRTSDSPVSMDDRGVLDRRVGRDERDGEEIPVVHVTPKVAREVLNDDPSEPSNKQKRSRRKTFTGTLDHEIEKTHVKREYKRRTIMSPKHGYCLHAVHYADTKAGEPPLLRDTLKDELPSTRTSLFKERDEAKTAANSEFDQHPAVRPLSLDAERSSIVMPDSSTSSSRRKGKEKEVESDSIADTDATSLSSVPTYMRCDCCGRIQKPAGFSSELSPVLENENLRTNFNFEVERQQPNHRRRSSSQNAGRPRFVPILPMEVGDETKQARIAEPTRSITYTSTPAAAESAPTRIIGVAVNKPGDVIGPSSTPLAIMPQPQGAPKFTRFGSLHVKKEDNSEDAQAEEQPVQNQAPPYLSRFSSLYGLREQAGITQELQPQRQLYTQQTSSYPPRQLQRSPPGQVARNGYFSSSGASQMNTAATRSKLSQEVYPDNSRPLSSSGQTSFANNTFQMSPPPINHSVIEESTDAAPIPPRNPARTSASIHRYEMRGDEDEPVVDLSSFDGSFVHGSLSRSATVLKATTPPSTSHGQQEQLMQMNTSSPPRPIRIDTNVPLTTSPTSAYSSVPVSNSAPVRPETTPTPSRPQSSHKSSPTTPRSNRDRDHDRDLVTTTTTVVTILPGSSTTYMSDPTSPTPITNSKGQLKLGDWVLPEGPRKGNKNISGRPGVGADGRVGVAA